MHGKQEYKNYKTLQEENQVNASQNLHCPIYTPQAPPICAPEELTPLLSHLLSNVAVTEDAQFPRGTITADGRLDLCKQGVGPEGCRLIASALEDNTNVVSLLLGTDSIGDTGAEEVARLAERNAHLAVLYLGCNGIGPVGTERLAHTLKTNTTVTGLWLKRNPVGAEGAVYLAEMLRHNTSLRVLDLVHTGMGREGLETILQALIHDNRSIQRLYLGGNNLMPEDTGLIADLLCKNDALEALLLNVNHLGEEGSKILAEGLSKNHTIRELGLASNGLNANSVAYLFDALRQHPSLLKLDMGYSPSTRVLGAIANRIGDNGAQFAAAFLARNPLLSHLDLRGNDISANGQESLKAALENNTHLYELCLSGKIEPELSVLLARNRASILYPMHRTDVALIRSVYRTTSKS